MEKVGRQEGEEGGRVKVRGVHISLFTVPMVQSPPPQPTLRSSPGVAVSASTRKCEETLNSSRIT